jgi:hypothetical protein
MKKSIILIGLLCATVIANAQHEGHAAPASTTTAAKPKSPRMAAMAMVGNNHVHIDYGSPSVRGRNIWNGLVAFDQVWATGAHRATTIDFSEDVIIDGKEIKKGKYGFFTIPGADTWVLIINKDWDMHLADDYNADNDIIRIKTTPKTLNETVEALTFEVKPKGSKKGEVILKWDKLAVSFDFQNM